MSQSRPASGGPAAGRPVARVVAPVLLRLALLVGLMAVIAVVGVLAATRSFDHLTDRLQPASAANQDVLLDLTSMEGAVGAWARSGQESSRDEYEQVLRQLPADLQVVREYAESDPQLDLLVTRLDDAAQAWIQQHAQPRIEAPGGPATFEPRAFRAGQQLFADVEEAHRATSEAFDRRVRQANADAQWRFRGTVVAVVLLALLAWVAVSRARTRLLRQLSEPLLELESVVQRMARQEPGVRAPEQGPREVRAVAAALNELADAQARARSVEARVQRELRTLDTAKDDFVSNVSHELRTPLTTISGYLELVAEEFEDVMQPRHERMLEATRRNVTRLKALIDDLLALSKAGSRTTDLETLDVGPVVRDAVTDVRITAAGRGIRIDVTSPDDAPLLVLGDRAMLHRAVLNLITNAVKFSHDDSSVEVRVGRERDAVAVAVTDHGIGIPKDELDRLGTRFFRASNAVTNEIAGTGLGIRIVQTIAEKHAGDLRIESTEGEGTTVVLRLPLQAGSEATDVAS